MAVNKNVSHVRVGDTPRLHVLHMLTHLRLRGSTTHVTVLKKQDTLIVSAGLNRAGRVIVGRAHKRHVTVHVWPHLSHAHDLTLHMNTIIIRQHARRPILVADTRAHLTMIGGDRHVNEIVTLGMEDTQTLPDETNRSL